MLWECKKKYSNSLEESDCTRFEVYRLGMFSHNVSWVKPEKENNGVMCLGGVGLNAKKTLTNARSK